MIEEKVTKPPIDSVAILTPVQNFINHSLHAKPDTSATIIISLIIFLVGFLINGFIKGFVAFNQRINIRRMFILNLNTIVTDLKLQCDNFDNIVSQLVFKDSENFTLKNTHLHQIAILQQIGYKETYSALFKGPENVILKIFSKKHRLRAFLDIWESIEFLSKWQDKPGDDSNKFVDYYNNQNGNRNEALATYMELIEPFLLRASKDPNLSEALKFYAVEIDKIHVGWQKTPNRVNPHKIQRKLVLPVRILNRKFDDVEVVYKTYRPLLQASKAYSEMSAVLKVYKEIFGDYSTSYHIRRKKITDSIKVLSNYF